MGRKNKFENVLQIVNLYYICIMELKIDRTKLLTVQNFSEKFGISRPTVYKRLEQKELEKVVIDGVTFVKIP